MVFESLSLNFPWKVIGCLTLSDEHHSIAHFLLLSTVLSTTNFAILFSLKNILRENRNFYKMKFLCSNFRFLATQETRSSHNTFIFFFPLISWMIRKVLSWCFLSIHFWILCLLFFFSLILHSCLCKLLRICDEFAKDSRFFQIAFTNTCYKMFQIVIKVRWKWNKMNP